MVLNEFSSVQPCGFMRDVDPRSARGQFRVSLGVAVALVLAIATSAFALRPTAAYDAANRRVRITDATASGQHAREARFPADLSNGG